MSVETSRPRERITNHESFTLLETSLFFPHLVSDIRNSRRRAWGETMSFQYEPRVREVFDEFALANARGVNTRFIFDSFSNYYIDGSLYNMPFLNRRKRHYQENLTNLRKSIQENEWVKEGHIPPDLVKHTPLPGIFGRNHKKIFIVDEAAYIGGVNLVGESLKRSDFMIRTTNKAIVHALGDIVDADFEGNARQKGDYKVTCDDLNSLYVDEGKMGKSIIMDTARQKISTETKNIKFISQF